VVALERAKADKKAHGGFRGEGGLGTVEIRILFYMGNLLKGVGGIITRPSSTHT